MALTQIHEKSLLIKDNSMTKNIDSALFQKKKRPESWDEIAVFSRLFKIRKSLLRKIDEFLKKVVKTEIVEDKGYLHAKCVNYDY